MKPMNACEYLARVGFAGLLGGDATPPYDEDNPASVEAAQLMDHRRIRAILLSREPRPIAGRDGVTWFRTITWPDRIAGLKTWAGNQTLAKLIKDRQAALKASEDDDLFAVSHPMKGVSGVDAFSARNAIDIGFSPAKVDMAIVQRPGLELLAIVGLELVPLVSFGFRECGFIHADRVWRFPVESRDGDYYHRWGSIHSIPISETGVR